MALGFDQLVFRQNHAVERHFVQDRVPFIDLWPALVAEDTIAPVSFADNSHLNPHGHEIAAGVIERYVRDRFAALVPDGLHARCAGPTRLGAANSNAAPRTLTRATNLLAASRHR